MRVIAGEARRTPLVTVRGDAVRPTSDKIKETLFNMLQPQIEGIRFLDLFAGSGGIGIEALSRGAKHAVFCDHSREAAACVRKNLTKTRLADRAEVHIGDFRSVLKKLGRASSVFDMVFLDPPYGKGLETEALIALKEVGLVYPGATVIVEAPSGMALEEYEDAGYRVERVKVYKTNQHVFLTPKEEEGPDE